MRVAVVGAGIGGLTAGLCLAQEGISDVTLYERSGVLSEIGAGIQISPNGSRILHELGLGAALGAVAVRPRTGDMRRWQDWSLLSSSPLGDDVIDEYGVPYYHVHRADLLRVLSDAVPPRQVALGRRLVGLEPAPDGTVTLRFAEGEAAVADVVIGADGIHSVVREALLGPEAPRYSGNSAWRGMVPAERVTDLELPVASTVVMGPGRHFVYYFVAAGRFVNWVGVAPSETWTLESWTAPGLVEEALADYDGWNHVTRRLITEVGRASGDVYRWALYDRDPLPTWGDGAVTLLGDAAHPMLPFMAQGACQAIEDGAVLAACLRAIADPVPALRRYEDLRRERTATVTSSWRRPAASGPSTAMPGSSATTWPTCAQPWPSAEPAEPEHQRIARSTAARARSRVESSVGTTLSSGPTSRGISVQARATASQPRPASRSIARR
jgi:salicylate hydroxylase